MFEGKYLVVQNDSTVTVTTPTLIAACEKFVLHPGSIAVTVIDR